MSPPGPLPLDRSNALRQNIVNWQQGFVLREKYAALIQQQCRIVKTFSCGLSAGLRSPYNNAGLWVFLGNAHKLLDSPLRPLNK